MFTPVILALKRLRQEDGHEFRNSLDYKVRLCLKKEKERKGGRRGREGRGREEILLSGVYGGTHCSFP